MDTIATSGLTKTYGKTTVVDHVDLRVPPGCVYGFLGPNGSGKSTTMKMLLALIAPTDGQAEVLGQPMTRANRREVLAHVGSLIEAPSVYPHLTGAENMRIVQKMLGLDDAAVTRSLATVRLEQHKDKLVKHYSLGMKQRLGIAMALARDPKVLILDEPTNGLDPAGIEEVRQLLISLAGEGMTVMVSSHLLAEMDRMAQVMGILDHGKLIFQGSRDELHQQSRPDLVIETTDVDRALDLLGSAAAHRCLEGVAVEGLTSEVVPSIVRLLAGSDVAIHGVWQRQQSLEEIFIRLTGRGGVL